MQRLSHTKQYHLILFCNLLLVEAHSSSLSPANHPFSLKDFPRALRSKKMSETSETEQWLAGLDAAFENFDEEDDTSLEEQREPIRVPRIPYNSITAEEFATQYSATNTPIILGDAFGPDGPVPQQFDLEYFKKHHSDDLVPLDVGTPSERVVKLGDYMTFSDTEMSRGYCRSLHTAEWFPDVNKELRFPDKLINPVNYLTLKGDAGFGYPKAWSRWFELFISNRECVGFPFLHKDMCATHALSMQVQGIKRFVLFPPSDSEFLYTFGETRTRSAVPHKDLVRFQVDREEFPLYSKASLHIADLRPGDVFFCPSDWWHTTIALSAEASVTLGGNYVDESNKEEFMGRWREYVNAQKLAAAGITRIEHGGKQRRPAPAISGNDAGPEPDASS